MAQGAEGPAPSCDGDPHPCARQPSRRHDCPHCLLHFLERRRHEADDGGGALETLQVAAQGERAPATDKDALEHAVAGGSPVVEDRDHRLGLLQELPVHVDGRSPRHPCSVERLVRDPIAPSRNSIGNYRIARLCTILRKIFARGRDEGRPLRHGFKLYAVSKPRHLFPLSFQALEYARLRSRSSVYLF